MAIQTVPTSQYTYLCNILFRISYNNDMKVDKVGVILSELFRSKSLFITNTASSACILLGQYRMTRLMNTRQE